MNLLLLFYEFLSAPCLYFMYNSLGIPVHQACNSLLRTKSIPQSSTNGAFYLTGLAVETNLSEAVWFVSQFMAESVELRNVHLTMAVGCAFSPSLKLIRSLCPTVCPIVWNCSNDQKWDDWVRAELHMLYIKAGALLREQVGKLRQISKVETSLNSSLKSLLPSQLLLPLSFSCTLRCIPPPHRTAYFTSKNILTSNY